MVGVSAVTGYGVGIVHYFREHKRFVRQLQDREAFLIVLDNVNRRLGNSMPLFSQIDRDKILERINRRRAENGEVLDAGIEIIADVGDSTDSTAPTDSLPDSNSEAFATTFDRSRLLNSYDPLQLLKKTRLVRRAPGKPFAKPTRVTRAGTRRGTNFASATNASVRRDASSRKTRYLRRSRTPVRRRKPSSMLFSRLSERPLVLPKR